jgi:epoxyqueuosine reductase
MSLSIPQPTDTTPLDQPELRAWLGKQAVLLGFDGLRITDTHLGPASERLQAWLAEGRPRNGQSDLRLDELSFSRE